MITRRDAVRLMGSAAAGAWFAAQTSLHASAAGRKVDSPRLAPGTPMSPERIALIEAFKQKSDGLEKRFEARTHKGDFVTPYRLFRPDVAGKLPLVIYLSGSGGQGYDNEKQIKLGNIFGTRVWLLPENQKSFPCYVLASQTDRGWVRYDQDELKKGVAKILSGLGEGARTVLEIVDELRRELPIDERRIYVMGQSMGGGGTRNVITNRPGFFAAAVICCGSITLDDGTGSIVTPVWNFHGDADKTVPVTVSRERIAARRKAGGRPVATEYAGVDHNIWEWTFTEPELVNSSGAPEVQTRIQEFAEGVR